jgi:hypothetical protein
MKDIFLNNLYCLKYYSFETRDMLRHEKSCKMSGNNHSEISNINTYVGKRNTIYKNWIPICGLKGHIYTNKCITFNVNIYLNVDDFTKICTQHWNL